MSSLEQEVRTLQKQVRRQRRWNLGLGALVVVGGLMAATNSQQVPDVIRAKKFEVVNDEGKVLVAIGNLAAGGVDNGMIVTRTSAGGVLAGITAGPCGGMIETRNGIGGLVARMGCSENGAGTVTTMNGKGGVLVQITSDAAGYGTIGTLNGKGRNLVLIGSTADGGAINAHNGKGQVLVRIGADASDAGEVVVLNGEGGVLVGVGREGGAQNGSVEVQNGKGRILTKLTALFGSGLVLTADENGEVTSRLP